MSDKRNSSRAAPHGDTRPQGRLATASLGPDGSAALVGLVGLLLATVIVDPPTLLVWNASPSSPMGLYAVAPWREPRPGDMAVAWVPPQARELAAARRYLPRNVPLVKKVAAGGGDLVCARGGQIQVNGKRLANRTLRDPAGRRLPRWSGCQRLKQGELLLIAADQPLAFDGRYFGITHAPDVLGRAVLLWAA